MSDPDRLTSHDNAFDRDTPGLILRIIVVAFVAALFWHTSNLIAELLRRHRRAEAGYELFRLHAHGVRVGVGAGIVDPGAEHHLLRHNRLEADPEALLLRDA